MSVKLNYKETEFEVFKNEDYLDVWYDDGNVMLKYTIDFEYPEPELYEWLHGKEEEEGVTEILWDTFELAKKHFNLKD